MRNRAIPTLSDADCAFVRGLLIHEDADLLAFDKPSGLPVQTRGNRGRSLDHLLWAFARSNGKRPRLVHRIDAGTSGLIVAAKTQPAAAHVSALFAARRVRKTYLALARGRLPDAVSGRVDVPLRKSFGSRDTPPMVSGDGEGAQPAITHWRILHRYDDSALFELRPKTGRMHQIRAHLQYLGCPILGDPLYGAGKFSAPRLMLHAARLRLIHPGGGDLDLSAPMPGDMQSHIQQL